MFDVGVDHEHVEDDELLGRPVDAATLDAGAVPFAVNDDVAAVGETGCQLLWGDVLVEPFHQVGRDRGIVGLAAEAQLAALPDNADVGAVNLFGPAPGLECVVDAISQDQIRSDFEVLVTFVEGFNLVVFAHATSLREQKYVPKAQEP